MKKFVLCIVLALFLSVTFNTVQATASMVFKFPVHEPRGSFNNNEYWDWFCKRVTEVSKGEIKIDLYPSESLCKGADQFEAVRDGLADVGPVIIPYESGTIKLPTLIELPFSFKDWQTSRKVWEAWLKAGLKDYYEQFGIVLLPGAFLTKFDIFSSKPIRRLEDMRGLKLRMPGKMSATALGMLGGVPISVTGGEIYTAIQTGTCDGTGLPAQSVFDLKINEVVKYGIRIDLCLTGGPLVVNKKVWSNLPKNLQGIMEKAAIEAQDNYMEKFDSRNEEALKRMEKEGIKIFTPDPAEKSRWVQKVMPLWETSAKDLGPKGEELFKILKSISGF